MKVLYWLVLSFTVVFVALWLLGNGLSDQTAATQWLEWIPTMSVVFILMISTVIMFLMSQKSQSVVSGILLIAVSVWYLTVENKVFNACNSQGQVRFVGWTMSHSKEDIAAESADLIIKLDADITLMTHGWYVRGEESIKKWLQPSGKRVVNGPFTLLTKLKPIEVTTLVASGGINISSFTLDASELLGRPIVLWAVDLPSEFTRQRFETAMIAKRLLSEIDYQAPDFIAGDFNMTRDSASIKYLFPTMQDAANEGGCGILASYPRAFPLYHIDHVLINNSLRAQVYKLINPDVGRHRVQLCEISNVD